MFFRRCFILVITLILCNIIPYGSEAKADGQTQEVIDTICKQNEDYGFCNKIINDNLKSPSAGIKDIVNLIIDLGLNKATDTYVFIGNILRKRPANPSEVAGLRSCLEVYAAENGHFTDAKIDVLHGDYNSIWRAIQGAPMILDNCRTNFVIPSYPKNPLIEMNREMRILITMAVVSSHMITK